MRTNSSRPSKSVPNQCAPDGGCGWPSHAWMTTFGLRRREERSDDGDQNQEHHEREAGDGRSFAQEAL
jgi:hypothetical protein